MYVHGKSSAQQASMMETTHSTTHVHVHVLVQPHKITKNKIHSVLKNFKAATMA